MQGSREYYNKRPKAQVKGCRELCCSCRLSVSSSEEAESCSSDRYLPISSLAHAMVQERLDQMIREAQEERLHEQRRSARRERSSNSKFIVMVATEKSSFDVREDFRESIMEMIMTNQIEEPKDLRRLLNCYISMNSEEYRRFILEVFHEDCPYFWDEMMKDTSYALKSIILLRRCKPKF
ncbi:Ovate protein family, C-terminal [Dillenia turbinata]|uniref:Transcription repressor n=1 Tax=Dillenia turbinata TaxID=194707 RepID=A0AAN8VEI7_9MAGN